MSRIVLVMQGRFTFHDRTTRAVASPSQALFLRAGRPFDIRHIAGEGDTCLSVQGDVSEAAVANGPTARPLSADAYQRLAALSCAMRAGGALDRLAVEQLLCEALSMRSEGADGVRTRERSAAEEIAYRIERDFDMRLTLAQLAAGVGLSIFHACRVFRKATGTSIHRHQQEIRLRHALALLLQTDAPIAQVAAQAGFANQGHLTNLFRRRFATTPAAARRKGLAVRRGLFDV